MKSSIPNVLLYSRLVFALVITLLAFYLPIHSKVIVLALMYLGIMTDIFDGILARRLNVSTERFRRLDTLFDLLFYTTILFFISAVNRQALYENGELVCTIFILEGLMYAISLTRFRRLPSPHAILSKFWGLYLIVEFTLLITRMNGHHFTIALIIGTLVHLDRVLIYVIIRKWDHDIPSSYHALLLRQGKTISRLKIFNG